MGRPKKVVAEVEEKAYKPLGRPKGSVKKILNERDRVTRPKAIRQMCTECMGFQLKLVNVCPDQACPLWPFRSGKGQEHTDVSIRK